MKILILTHERNLNGSSRSMLNLIDYLSGENEFFVATPYIDGPVVEELYKRNVVVFHNGFKRWVKKRPKNKVLWSILKLKWICYEQFYNIWVAYKLKACIETHGIQLIHTNTSVINIGAILHRLTKIPHVWYIREFGQEDFSLYQLGSVHNFYNTINKYSSVIVTVSNALRNKYEKYIKDTDIVTIYNGVEVKNIITDRKYCNIQICSFLIAGTIQPGKGQDIAVKAVKKLIDKGYRNFKLYIAGRGDVQWLKNIPEFVEEYVEFLGQVDNMVELRRRMDVELVCSKSEAFGRVTVEAMMSGMPVIGSDTGGTPEIINDGETGLLYKQGDAEELASKMRFFIEEPDRISLMGQKAQEYSKYYFSIERCAKEVQNIYGSLVPTNNKK